MRHFDLWVLRNPWDIWHFYRSRQRWKEEISQMIRDRVTSVPGELEARTPVSFTSPLTSDDEGDGSGGCTTPIQSDSSFLNRLPTEIRLQIYGYVFGDGAVHLVHIENRIRHVRCEEKHPSLHQHRQACCPLTVARWRSTSGRGHRDHLLYPHTHTSLPSNLSNSNLSLLRTCRQIYAEAIDIPYSTLTFDVDDLHTWIYFCRNICPDRLAAIKNLTVQWSIFWDPMTGSEPWSSVYSHSHKDTIWEEFWRLLASPEQLTSLINLRLVLNYADFPTSTEAMVKKLSLDSGWVAPILKIRSLKSFDLRITSKKDNPVNSKAATAVESLRDQIRLIICSTPNEVPRGGVSRSEPILPKFLSCQEYEVSSSSESDEESDSGSEEEGGEARRQGRNPIPGLLQRMEEMGARYDKLYRRKQGMGRRRGQLALTAS
ncbi:hypothetical protein FQN54_002128 [Arachnomyces sp. PD_36]|nr:hypothetical protein FQN54_002128 [Arachnomyces sp. PD_36]